MLFALAYSGLLMLLRYDAYPRANPHLRYESWDILNCKQAKRFIIYDMLKKKHQNNKFFIEEYFNKKKVRIMFFSSTDHVESLLSAL